jgi:hypothetical protein
MDEFEIITSWGANRSGGKWALHTAIEHHGETMLRIRGQGEIEVHKRAVTPDDARALARAIEVAADWVEANRVFLTGYDE